MDDPIPPGPGRPSAAEDRHGSQLIGVDLGGTAIKLLRCRRNGEILAELETPTPCPAMPGAVTMALAEAIGRIDPDRCADRVGIGHPGPSDATGRVARIAINLPGWRDVPLADWLEPRLERAVTLENDANCALLGEAWLGAARASRDALVLTLGTGVGGGVLLDGRLFRGRRGAAAEPGLICVDPDPGAPPCSSGNRGSLEQYCSIAGVRRIAGVEPDELCRRADAGDPTARAAWEVYGHWLGIGLSSLLYVLDPELVLLGGGLSRASHHFLPAVHREVEERVLAVNREDLTIRPCALGNRAGSLGAAWLAAERLG
jgi:glucokinase